MKFQWLRLLIAVAVLSVVGAGCNNKTPSAPKETAQTAAPALATDIVLATTTSVNDTGLLDVLAREFEKQTGIAIKPIAVGTGKALALGERGEADVVLVHAPPAEDAFIRAGHGIVRNTFMQNHMLIAGPKKDPAGVGAAASAPEALQKIAEAKQPFMSRGDDSGTHKKERELWARTDMKPSGDWYMESGQGMANTLRIADEKQSYVLTDLATFLSLKNTLSLKPLLEDGKDLLNVYSAIVVNPQQHPKVKSREAQKFVDFLQTPDVQKLIGAFGVEKFGQPLFTPSMLPSPTDADGKTP